MTSLKGTLGSVDLANVFQMLSMNQREGTLYIFDGHSRKAIYFGTDGVSMLTRGRHKPDSLGRILVRNDKLTPAQLQESLRLQKETSGRLLGQILVEQGLVTRTDVEEALRTQIEEEVYSLFIWKDAQFEFVEGPPDEEFTNGDGVARLTFSVNSLIMEAAKRVDEWEWIQRVIPSTDEIYRYTGANVALDDEIFGQPWAGKVLASVDGRRSVDEIVAVSCVNRFEVTKMLALLLEGGAVETLPVPDLRREAQEALAAQDTGQSVKFLTRLVALRGDSPEMHRQLAEVFEGQCQLERAAHHYKVYAEIVATSADRKAAFETYLRICGFLPTDLAAADRMIEIFASNPEGIEQHGPAVIARGKLLADIYGELGRRSRAIQVLHRIVALGPEDQDLRGRLIQVYLQAGMPGEAIAEYEALAEAALAMRDYDEAERICRKILQIDRNREDAQARLNQILARRRMRQRGIRAAVGLGLLVVAGAWGGWTGWRWWQDRKVAETQLLSEFSSRFAALRSAHTPILADVDRAIEALAGALGEPKAMAKVLREGGESRKVLAEKASAAAQSCYALVTEFPAVGDSGLSTSAAQEIERRVSHMQIQEDKVRASLLRTIDEMFERMEPLPPPFALEEQDRVLTNLLELAKAVPQWLGSGKGEQAQSYAKNVSQTLEAYRAAKSDAEALLERNDVAAAQDRILAFLVQYFPPRDVLEHLEIPRSVVSRPSGARVIVDDQDTGLVTPAVLRLPLARKAVLRLVHDGFEQAVVEVQGAEKIDPKTVRERLQLTVSRTLHKELAFRSAPLGSRISATPAATNDRVIAATRGSEAALLEYNGATRGTFATKSGGGVQVRPVVRDGVVAFASYDGFVFAYPVGDPSDLIRRIVLSGKVQADPVETAGGIVYADLDGHLTSVDVRGREITARWQYPSSGPGRPRGFPFTPAADGDEIVAVSGNGTIHVVRASNGAEIRALPVREGSSAVELSTGVAVAGDLFFGVVPAQDGRSRILSIDRRTHEVRASWTVEGRVRWAPVVWQGIVHALTDDGLLVALRLSGDSFQSERTLAVTSGTRIVAEPAFEAGVLYVGDSVGALRAVDLRGSDMEILWDFHIPGSDRKPVAVTTRPAVTGGYVLFGAGDNAVYGLRQ